MLKYMFKNHTKPKKNSHFAQYLSRLFKKKAHNGSREVSTAAPYFTSETSKLPSVILSPPNLSTLPSEKLKSSIRELLTEGSGIDVERINSIECEIETIINERCPFETSEQYDFCVLCAQSDMEDAGSMKEELSSTFNLKGYTVWDSCSLGTDQFFALEDLLRTSTVVLLYVSNSFTTDEFCCHVARNILITPLLERARLRVVPVLKDIDTPLPEVLQLVDKLVLQNKLRFNFRFSTIFNDSVRQERYRRQYDNEVEIDLRRKRILLDLVKEKIHCEINK